MPHLEDNIPLSPPTHLGAPGSPRLTRLAQSRGNNKGLSCRAPLQAPLSLQVSRVHESSFPQQGPLLYGGVSSQCVPRKAGTGDQNTIMPLSPSCCHPQVGRMRCCISGVVNDSAKPMSRNKCGSTRTGGLRGTVLLLGLLPACHLLLQELQLPGDAGEASK